MFLAADGRTASPRAPMMVSWSRSVTLPARAQAAAVARMLRDGMIANHGRYPVVDEDGRTVVGIVSRDYLLAEAARAPGTRLWEIASPARTVTASALHAAGGAPGAGPDVIVTDDQGAWVGWIPSPAAAWDVGGSPGNDLPTDKTQGVRGGR